MKILVWIGVGLVVLLGVALSLPFLIDLNKYQNQYRPLVEDAFNRKIQLQDIRLTIWPRIGARVEGFTVLDDPLFSDGPFASLRSLDVGVKLFPLLSSKVEIEEITLRDPVITVIKNKNGVVNVATIGTKTPPPPTTKEPSTPPPSGDPLQALALFAVDRVAIDGGTLTYRDLSTTPVTEYRLHDLDLLLKAVHLGENPTLHLRATVEPYNFPVTLDGTFGPLVQTLEVKQCDFMLGLGKIALALKGSLIGGKLDALLTSPSISTADLPVALPLTKPVLFKDIRILAKAPYPLKQSVSALELADVTDLGLTVVTGNSSMNVKGTVLDGHAKVTLTSLSVSTADLPVETGFKKPVDLKNLEVNANVIGQAAQISNLSFQLFNGQVKADGGLVMESSAPPFRGKFTIHDLQVSPVLQALNPDSVVSLSGTAALALAVAGRGFSMPDLTRSLEGPGRLEVKDGKIEGVNLVQEAMALLKVAGIQVDQGKATAFSSIETDVLIKQGAVRVQKFLMDGHEFQATGSGTVGFDQTLNLAVNLSLRQDLSRKIAGSSSLIKLALKDGRLTVPLRITGSAQNPSYGLDMKWLTGIVQEQAQEKVKEAVGGLLKGTTKPEDLKQQGRDLIKGLFGR